jgi:hypothetical protein
MDEQRLSQWLITVLFGAVAFFVGDTYKNKRIDDKDATNRLSLTNLEQVVQGLNLTLSTLTVQVQSLTKEVEKLHKMNDKVIRTEERILALERLKSDGGN